MVNRSAYAVVGRPIGFSRSPGIFTAGFAAAGLPHAYTRMAADSGAHALQMAKAIGLRGLSVTAPFKEDMCAVVECLDETARALGAVNLVCLGDGESTGMNTDPVGVGASLDHFEVDPGTPVVVLGAGGAGVSVCHELSRRGFSRVTIINRTPARAQRIAQKFGFVWQTEERSPGTVAAAALVISCLPFHATLPPSFCLSPAHRVIDAAYNGSPVQREAQRVGCAYLGGGTWLVAQASRGFAVWTGDTADTQAMTRGLDAAVFGSLEGRPLALVGLPGSGKSTVGGLLAAMLHRRFLDTDRMVEERMGYSVAEIFAHQGEAAFRGMEARAVEEALGCGDPVVALGGGAAENQETTRRLAGIPCVWLWADLEACVRRADDHRRPLLEGSDPLGALRRLLDARRSTYCAVADLLVDTTTGDPAQVARRIADEAR